MSHPESSTVESTSLGRQQKQSLRRSARISTSSTQPQQPETSSIPDPPAVQFPASSPRKRKRAQQQDSDLPVAGPSVSRRRLSASNPTQPSSKSLGKRRAVSPESLPLHQEHPTEAATSRNPKKRKVNNPKPVSSASYNLRKRQGAVESTDQVAPSSSSAPSASTSKGKGKMPGKKEKKTAANEAKARAAEAAESSAMAGRAEETAAGMLPPSGERAAKKRSRRSPKSSAGAASSGSAPAPGGSSNEVRMQVGEPIAGDEQEHQEVVLEYSDGDSQDESEEGEDVLPFGDQHPFPGDDDDDDDDDDEDMDDDEHELGREFADAAAAMMDGPGDADGGAAAGLFGSFAASLAGFGMVSGLNARLKNILNQLRDRSGDPDATQKLVALQELSEILSISTEDTLAGFFNVEAFVQELVNILSPHPSTAISVVDLHGEETGIEMMLLACRCLANLMEALPGTSHSVYHAGAVPVLCSKLVEIQYIDLAEQTLSTLEKMASEMPGPVVREGGLSALLSYLDFFSTNVQRTAVTAAAHCCRSLSPESFNMVKEVAPILVNVLGYSDQRVVEQACLAVTRITESYRHHPDKLEALLTPQLFSALLALLTPGSSLLTSNTFTSVLRSLALAARASPNVAIELIQGHIADTLYHLLAGAVPPPKGKEVVGVQKRREEDDMAVLQNLVHRPKDQILEALVLASELLPTLPRDGLFSSKPNASRSKAGKKATVKVIKREESSPAPSGSSALVPSHGALAEPLDVPATSVASAEPAESISQQPQQTPHQEQEDEEAMQSVAAAQVKTEETSPTIDSSSAASTAPSAALTAAKAAANLKEAANDLRIDLLQNTSPPERLETVARFHALLLPTLVDVYSASVGISVRSKSMLALTKIMHFAPKDLLALVLESLPVASFLGAILASKDQPLLVTNGLQVVELLLLKLPDKCNYLFRRQGVLHEVERLAEVPLNSPPKDKEKQKGAEEGEFDHGVPSVANTSTGGLNRGFLLGSLARTSVADLGAGVGDESHFKDLVTLRARFMRDRYCAANSNSSSAIQATKDLESIKLLAAQLESCNEGPHSSIDLKDILHRIANLFSNTDNPISSFELQESGLIDALLKFALGQRDLSVQAIFERRKALADVFVPMSQGSDPPQALSLLIKCLQDSLSRLEDFEVKTALQGSSDDRRNSASMLTRQLRFRLVAEDSDVPRSCSNVIVAIHAIATFQAFNEYLRPRISAAATLSGGSGSALAAAFEAAGRLAERDGAASASADVAPESAEVDKGSSRRRSTRLSTKASASDLATAPQEPPGDVSGLQEPIDEQVNDESSDHELTTNVEPAPDGSKLEGHTPGGTRVGTPSSAPRPGLPSGRARGSYAAALKTPSSTSDWHLKFYMGEQELSLDSTVYGAVHHFESQQNNAAGSRTMWSNVYTVRFKKVPGPPSVPSPRTSPEPTEDEGSLSSGLPESVPSDSKEAKILQLLRVLHSLNSDLPELLDRQSPATALPSLTFVNNKLTAKLNRQLEEPMIVASSCLPDWALDLPQSFPFLFPFETRFSFLQSTSFGYARLMAKWVAAARQDSRRDDSLSFLGRLSRQKVRISRDALLGSAFKVLELYATSRAMIEIEFFDEVGTGLGPTLEFYALVSKEFSRKELDLWRPGEENPTSFVQSKTGLFPAPLALDANQEKVDQILSMFKLLAQFLAKGLLDSRITDVGFNRTFMKLVQEQDLPLTIAAVKTVDPILGKSLEDLRAYVDAKERILKDDSISNKSESISNIRVRDAHMEDLSLDFTLPGFPNIELRANGSDTAVTIDNVHEYIELVVDFTLKRGVYRQVQAFREAFSQVFPVKDLACFSAEELTVVFGSGAEDWSIETMQDALRADHGFSMESKPVKEVLDIMNTFSEADRRSFLRFATGSPRLPVGGFRALHPPLTIVRKPPESGHQADEYLPSVMTCQNYIKLPEYSSRQVMEARLTTAITEGQGAFHLS